MDNVQCYIVFPDKVFASVNMIPIFIQSFSVYYVIQYFIKDSKNSREGLMTAAFLEIISFAFIMIWAFIYFVAILDPEDFGISDSLIQNMAIGFMISGLFSMLIWVYWCK